jgi:hypothetical protein
VGGISGVALPSASDDFCGLSVVALRGDVERKRRMGSNDEGENQAHAFEIQKPYGPHNSAATSTRHVFEEAEDVSLGISHACERAHTGNGCLGRYDLASRGLHLLEGLFHRVDTYIKNEMGATTVLDLAAAMRCPGLALATHMPVCHIYGMAKKTTLYIEDQELALLKQVSEQEGVAQGAIISRALRSYFRSRLKKAKSIGMGRSGRRDLSENTEALLDGFGE